MSGKAIPRIRLAIRLIILLVAVFAASGWIGVLFKSLALRYEDAAAGDLLARIARLEFALALPALSPFLALTSALAARTFALANLMAVFILILAVVRRRWFCCNACPTGLLCDFAGRLNKRARSRLVGIPNIGPWLLAVAIGASLAGYPLLLWLDPLSLFNGFFGALRAPLTIAVALAAGLVVVVLASIWRPGSWCYRVCPLGAMQELVFRLRRKSSRLTECKPDGDQAPEPAPAGPVLTRGEFLGLLVGGAAGSVLRFGRGSGRTPIRPPGTVSEDTLGGLCARCGNCMNACPEKIIKPDLDIRSPDKVMVPVVRIDSGYCRETCSECGRVCPTGAIKRMSLDEKKRISIGTATVLKEHCIAWEQGGYCMVCHEHCPFLAIKIIPVGDVNCPEVDPERCRGCGFCQVKCPADVKAIVVHGTTQRVFRDG